MEKDVCCPRFDPDSWERKIVWKDKLFVKGTVRSILHVPINMGQIITKMWKKVKDGGAEVEAKDWILLSEEAGAWKSYQYMAVNKEVEGMENVKMSGTFLTQVFEGPYQEAKDWYGKIIKQAEKETGKKPEKVYFYYTTCPKCAKKYGNNYVVGLAKIS